jgi:hypothetical protein
MSPVPERWRRELGVVFDRLIPDHDLRIVSVAVGDEAITLHYLIIPALPGADRATGGQPWLTWNWDGVDDLGNDYQPWGGAYGTSDDGLATVGDLDLHPAPAPGARNMLVHLAPFRHSEGDLGAALVELPLPGQMGPRRAGPGYLWSGPEDSRAVATAAQRFWS